MDTRHWGGSAWVLLHGAAFAADAEPALRPATARLMAALPFALPCKFCRASLTAFLRAEPPPNAGSAGWAAWLYRVHNRVNAKLRRQGLLRTPSPSFAAVRQRFARLYPTLRIDGAATCSTGNEPPAMRGWDFLASVAWTTPPAKDAAARLVSAPMPDVPTPAPGASRSAHNEANTLSPQERRSALAQFWRSLGPALPLPSWRTAWAAALAKEGAPPVSAGPRAVTAWLVRMRRRVTQQLCDQPPDETCPSFSATCAELKAFASSCGHATTQTAAHTKTHTHPHASTVVTAVKAVGSHGSHRATRTCRAKKLATRRAFTRRRRQLYAATGGFM